MKGLRLALLTLAGACLACAPASPDGPPARAVVASAAARPSAPAPPAACVPADRPSCSADGFCLDQPWSVSATLRAVWSSGPDDVYIGGDLGAALHFDGRRWSRLPLQLGRVSAIWGSGPSDVYLLDGDVHHFDGVRWTTAEVPPRPNGYGAVAGSSARDVWIGGEGFTAHYDGTRWREVPIPWKTDGGNPGTFAALWVDADGVAWGGAIDRLARFDGKRWEIVRRDSSESLSALTGVGRHVYAAIGWSVVHFDGTRWTEAKLPKMPVGLWAAAPDDVYAVAGEGVFHFDGATWSELENGKPERDSFGINDLTAIAGSPGGRVTAVGWDGVVLSRAIAPGATDPGFTTLTHASLHTLDAVWGAAGDDIWAAGGGPFLHFDGCRWTPVPVPSYEIMSLWGSGPRDVFAVGWKGEIFHWDGSRWRAQASNTNDHLLTVWGRGPDDVWAAGERGTVLHFDGAHWSEHARVPTPEDVGSIAGSPNGALVASGRNGGVFTLAPGASTWVERPLQRLGSGVYSVGDEVLFLDRGGEVRRLVDGFPSLGGDLVGAFSMHGTSARDLFTVGVSGRAQHFDGKTFTTVAEGLSDKSLRGVWAHPDAVVFVGDDGTIVRKDRRARAR